MASHNNLHSQRAWARLAGLMYWVVLVVDLTGMNLRPSNLHSSLMLSGSLFTVLLALGLYYAVRPVQAMLALTALACRLTEAGLGVVSCVAGFPSVHPRLANSSLGSTLLQLASWGDSTNFAAFIFAVGSTIFFALFLKARSIPRIIAIWGLFSSVLALSACLAHLVWPAFPSMTMWAWMPMLLAETSTGLWLLIKSVKVASPGGTERT
jgi:hypothetical protein